MKILAIETSCDETAVAIIEAKGGLEKPEFSVLSNIVLSQVKIHEQYGGVFPHLAKREHAKNLTPVLKKAIEEARLEIIEPVQIDSKIHEQVKYILAREHELYSELVAYVETIKKPEIDLIAVTSGPGLDPALWVGINAARALGLLWNIPVLPMNHMEGHIASVLLNTMDPGSEAWTTIKFPALALLISGGHTELVSIEDWTKFKVIGETRDDAVGEAFDKVARMLDLPYPGGPQISKLAEEARSENLEDKIKFPRPMINTDDLDFSFSGLKTSVLYFIKKTGAPDEKTKKEIAYAFEEAVIEVLVSKTQKALEESNAKTLIVAGGVIANKAIRTAMEKLAKETGDVKILIPPHYLSTDNALMIALGAYVRSLHKEPIPEEIKAEGGARLGAPSTKSQITNNS